MTYYMLSLLSCVLVGSPPSEQEQGQLVDQVVLGVVVGLLCVVLGLVLVCAAVTCLKLLKARRRRECNCICNSLYLCVKWIAA